MTSSNTAGLDIKGRLPAQFQQILTPEACRLVVELTREFAQAPQSMEEMTRRLERAVAAQPDSAEGLYFLGRTYMAQDRPADAAKLVAWILALEVKK